MDFLERMAAEAAQEQAVESERAACAELVRAAGCVCFILEAADAAFQGEIEEQEDETGEGGSLYQIAVHDSRCPIALAAAIEARGRA